MARTHRTGPVFNNYVTIRLLARRAVGNGQTNFVVDSMVLPAKFCASGISFFGLGSTATVTYGVFSGSSPLTTGNGVVLAIQTLANGVVNRLTPGTLKLKTPGQAGAFGRLIPKGAFLQLAVTTDGTGAVPAGAFGAWVTGYFVEPITRVAKYAESGQSSGERPVAGYLDLLSLINVRANANQAAREECALQVPYDCRVQAIFSDVRGGTFTTGTTTLDIRKNDTTILSAALDLDANPQTRLDFDSTPTFASSAARDFVRGDKLSLYLSTGLNDTVPIASCDAHVLVWVKGHVRDLNLAADTAVGVED